jgi:hypothetical protein
MKDTVERQGIGLDRGQLGAHAIAFIMNLLASVDVALHHAN